MRWLVLRVEGGMDNAKVVDAIRNAAARRSLAARLGSGGVDQSHLREQVRIFDGELHYRVTPQKIYLSMLLHDARQLRANDAVPVRLWVH
jgi:hypothetical protein